MVVETCRHKDCPSLQGRRIHKCDPEEPLVRIYVCDCAWEEPASVPFDFMAGGPQELCGIHSVAREEAMHLRSGPVSRLTGVNDKNVGAGSREYESGTQAGGSSANDDYVRSVYVVHKRTVAPV